ncbi:DUF2088 domain-containing protein, partial [SAR202 cluster bacterium AD-802-E10_MRT_200m]|nr:DUF2088 domain-containing protein [SAR202 cluster bacterium AD-802-E10_MRT_200m]
EDVDKEIEEALNNPLGQDPLSAQVRPGMSVTIAFDDASLPLPPMRSPDLRGRIIEKVLEILKSAGVVDIHLIAALGLHRRMTPAELKHAVGPKVFREYYPRYLYNHDAEDPDNQVLLGKTELGEEVEISRRVAESDLLIYVNINLVSMDGGHKSINTGLVTYRTLKNHHNVHTLMRTRSLMDPPNSALHHSCDRMGTIVDKYLKVFKIETTLNSNTFPMVLRHLQEPEWNWKNWEKVVYGVNRLSLDRMPFRVRHKIFHSIKAPYGLTGIAAGDTDQVHKFTLDNVFRQQVVPVEGQADILLAGLTYLGPYNVNSYMNPILVHCQMLGYIFNLYRGKPLVRKGGVLIFTHPLTNRFHPIHHPSYLDFYNKVLPETRDPAEIEQGFEESFAYNQKYIELYRNSYAFHGVHPLYMWYWACYGQHYLGRVIVVGAQDKEVANTLGYEVAPSMDVALDMAKDIVGTNPQVTALHYPPIFLCDVI